MDSLDVIRSTGNVPALPNNIDVVAPADSAVLIQCQAGTGKGLIARAVHEPGVRRKNCLVEPNCATKPPSGESELWRHSIRPGGERAFRAYKRRIYKRIRPPHREIRTRQQR